jgi:hypothetical protein
MKSYIRIRPNLILLICDRINNNKELSNIKYIDFQQFYLWNDLRFSFVYYFFTSSVLYFTYVLVTRTT